MLALPIALVLLSCHGATPIDEEDLRDLVVLTTGEELHGRVERAYAPDIVVLFTKGNRRVIERSDVASMSTVASRLAEWLKLSAPGLSLAREWELVGLAEAADLHATARLQATRVLTIDPDHAEAHAFLGHTGKPGRWKWRVDDRFVSAEKWYDATTDERSPLAFESEHWSVRCDSGPTRALEIAFDLERLYAAWMDEIGSEVDAREVLLPMIARVHSKRDEFRPLSSLGLAYYDPGHLLGSTTSEDNAFYTFYELPADRPERLIDLAVQQLIYSSILGDKLRTIPRDATDYREAACLEVGLGDWYERRWEGPAGFGRVGAWRPDKISAELALVRAHTRPLDVAKNELTNLIQTSWVRLIQVREENDLMWAKCRTFVAFLMENGAVLPAGGATSSRAAVMDVLRRIYGVPTGNSSRSWDEALGSVRIEDLDGPWRRWLQLLP